MARELALGVCGQEVDRGIARARGEPVVHEREADAPAGAADTPREHEGPEPTNAVPHGDYRIAKMAAVDPSPQARAFRAARTLARRLRSPSWGRLRRMDPFTADYGWSRGVPVDRRLIDAFLAAYADDITGDVLEVKDRRMADRFGEGRVRSVTVVDVDATNPRATLVADLGRPGSLPAARFDCFILSQTLQYVADVDAALGNAWSALRPGGTLLVTVPVVTRVDPAHVDDDLWRWSPAGLRRLMERTCAGADVEVSAAGNLVTSIAFLAGLAVRDLRPRDFEPVDPMHATLACARARKP